jgi:hypothetical protein
MADTTQINPQSSAASRPADEGAGNSIQDFSRIGTDLMDALGERAEAIVSEQKTRAASEIAALATMLRSAAQNVDQGNRGAISGYATDIAGEIDRFADRLRVSSWRVLAADVEDIARRWPALFMASSAVAGFVLGRVLTSPPSHLFPGRTPTGEGPSAGPLGTQQSSATGGTLSQGGAATRFGMPAGEETP